MDPTAGVFGDALHISTFEKKNVPTLVWKRSRRKTCRAGQLKQTDFSGYETESITFSEQFEKDQQKTVTTHLPASQVPFIQSSDWIIEAYKY